MNKKWSLETQERENPHSWHEFIEKGPRPIIAQLWKLFSCIIIRILKISFWNCDFSLLSRYALYDFSFYRRIRFDQSPEPLIPQNRNLYILPCPSPLHFLNLFKLQIFTLSPDFWFCFKNTFCKYISYIRDYYFNIHPLFI